MPSNSIPYYRETAPEKKSIDAEKLHLLAHLPLPSATTTLISQQPSTEAIPSTSKR